MSDPGGWQKRALAQNACKRFNGKHLASYKHQGGLQALNFLFFASSEVGKPAQMRAKKAQVIKPGWNASRAQLRASIVAIYTKVTTQHFNSAIGALRQPLQPPPNPRQRRLPQGPQFHAKKKPLFRPDDHLSGHPQRPYSASVALMIIVNARTSKRSLQRREETD